VIPSSTVCKPLYLTPVSFEDIDRGDGPYVDQFIEGYCRITKESVGGHAGELLRLRPWQNELTSMVHARRPDGRLRHREALIGLPRKNGKSALGSGLGLYGLMMGSDGSEIYSCAADKEQARIVFGVARRMVETDPFLSEQITCYRDTLEYTSTGSTYKVLSSEAFTKEGLNPTEIIYDELHAAPTDELYNVMAEAQGARIDPLFVIITTAGVKSDQTGQDSICYRRYQYGLKVASGEIFDPNFFMAWYGAPEDDDYKAVETHKRANPGYGDLIDPEDFASVLSKVSEADFRTKRLNQWVNAARAWLPQGSWGECYEADRSSILQCPRGVVLGFDGSKSGDCTALVVVSIEAMPQIAVLGLWERPIDDPHWKVPRSEVREAIRQACRDYDVREIAWDEWLWLDSAEELEDEGLPVVIFPQSLSHMGPATQKFFERVRDKTIVQDGDPRLTRHLNNATTKTDARGTRIVKDAANSPRKIDLAVAAVMATSRVDYYMTADRNEYGGTVKNKYALPVAARDDGTEIPSVRGEADRRRDTEDREDGSPGFVW
jgi:phage terminase large subunit-like protein